MVFAGSVEFGIGFNEQSISRSVNELRARFNRIDDLQINARLSDQGILQDITGIRQQLDAVNDVRLDVNLDTNIVRDLAQVRQQLDALNNTPVRVNFGQSSNQANSFVQGIQQLRDQTSTPISVNTTRAERDVVGLQTAFRNASEAAAALSQQRIEIEVNNRNTQAQIARIDSQIQQLRNKEVQITVNANNSETTVRDLDNQIGALRGDIELRVQARTDEINDIERRIESLRDNQIRLAVDPGTSETLLNRIERRIEDLDNQRITLEADSNLDAEITSIEARINRLQNRRLRIEADTQSAEPRIREIQTRLETLNDRRVRLELDSGNAASEIRDLDQQIDALGGSNANRVLRELNRQFSDIESTSRQAERGVGQFNSVIAGLTSGATSFALDAIRDGISEVSQSLVNFARDTAQVGTSAIAADLAFTTILGSASEAQTVLGELVDFAATTPFDLPGVREAGQQLLAFGFETQELIPTLTAVGDVAAGVGVPFGELAEIYGRARVQNRLFAEDINQLTGRGIPIIGELAEQFGVAESEVRSLVESGQVGFANLEVAFQSLTSEGGRFAGLLGDLSQTTAGQFSNLSDTVTQFQEALFRAIDPALGAGLGVISDALAEAGSESQALDIIGDSAQRLADSLRENPELAERLGSAIANIADSGATLVANTLDQINEALSNPENIERWADAITSAGDQITGFVSEIQAAIGAVENLINGLDRLPGLDLSLENFQDNSQLVQFDGPLSRALSIGDFAPSGADGGGFTNLVNAAQRASDSISDSFAAIAAPEVTPDTNGVDEAIRTGQALEAIQTRLAQSDIERINALSQVAGAQSTAADAAASRAQIEVDAARRAIAIQQEQIDILEGQDPEANAEEIQRIEARIANARLEIAQTLADEQVRLERETTQQIEAELSARERLNQLQGETTNLQFEVDNTGLQSQLAVAQALAGADQARITAAGELISAQLAQAQAVENFSGVEEARDRLLLNQLQSIRAGATAQQQQTRIQRQLLSLDGQRQVTLAQIARDEAQIAVERARGSSDTTDQELQALQSIVSLRERGIESARENLATQLNVLDIQQQQQTIESEAAEAEALRSRRLEAVETALERQNDLLDDQKELEEDIASATERRQGAIDDIVSSLGSLENVSAEDALGNLNQLEENLRTVRGAGLFGGEDATNLQRAIDQAQRLSTSGGEFSIQEAFRFAESQNPFASSILDSLGLGGVNAFTDAQQELMIAETQIEELTGKLDEVKGAIEDLVIPVGIENLTISTPDPATDAGTVLADISRNQRELAGLS